MTLFIRACDTFIAKAKERKFIVRDFKWDAQVLSDEKKELEALITQEKELAVDMLDLVVFNEAVQG